jgi:muramoyltetrapeptide carboxypeptidase LdcA involved in peptidoglycan recycling
MRRDAVSGDLHSREGVSTPTDGDEPAFHAIKVAVLSPSWAAPGFFPEAHERSMVALKDHLGLVAVELPTTRQIGVSPQGRADDLMVAFADPEIKAVLSSIGGDDQLTVLPHLDPKVFIASPKRFFSYSDNTNFLNYLWNLGITGYHGGSTMVHLARPGGVHPVSIESLRIALFTNDTVEIAPVPQFTDLGAEWADPLTLEVELETTTDEGWHWRNSDRVVSGPSWGGNLEVLHWNFAANRWIRPSESYAACVLLLETSEEMPTDLDVFRMLRNAGERGLLEQFEAILVAKPKAWSHENRTTKTEQASFREKQRAAIEEALDAYCPDTMAVFGLDFGHTDPQHVLPYGGLIEVDGVQRNVKVTY